MKVFQVIVFCLVALQLFSLFQAQTCPGNKIVDPGFEGVTCSGSQFCQMGTGPLTGSANWVVKSGSVDVLHDTVKYYGYMSMNAVDLSGSVPGDIYQDFSLPSISPGSYYNITVSYYVRANPDSPSLPRPYTLKITDQVTTNVLFNAIETDAASLTVYVLHTESLSVLTGSTFRLEFISGASTGGFGAVIDFVCVTAAVVVIMTPAPQGSPTFHNSFEVDHCGWKKGYGTPGSALFNPGEVKVVHSGYNGIPSYDGTHFLSIENPVTYDGGPLYTFWGTKDCYKNFTDMSAEVAIYLNANHVATGIRSNYIGICSALSGPTGSMPRNTDCGYCCTDQIIGISNSHNESNVLFVAYGNNAPLDTSINPQKITQTGWYVLKESYYTKPGSTIIFWTAALSYNGMVVASFNDTVRKDGRNATTADAYGWDYFWFCQPCDCNPFTSTDTNCYPVSGCSRAEEIYIDDSMKYPGFTAPVDCTECEGCCSTGCLGATNCRSVNLNVTLETSPSLTNNSIKLSAYDDLGVKFTVDYEPGSGKSASTLGAIDNIQCLVQWDPVILKFQSSLYGECHLESTNGPALCTFKLLSHLPTDGRFGKYSAKLLFRTLTLSGTGTFSVACQTDLCGSVNFNQTANTTSSDSYDSFSYSVFDDSTTTCSEDFVISHFGETLLKLEDDGDLYACPTPDGDLDNLCSIVSAYRL